MNKSKKLISVGCGGTVFAMVCCFTPALVLFLGAVGMSAFVGWWLDLILFPAMAIFMAMTGYGIYLRRKAGRGVAAGAAGE